MINKVAEYGYTVYDATYVPFDINMENKILYIYITYTYNICLAVNWLDILRLVKELKFFFSKIEAWRLDGGLNKTVFYRRLFPVEL